VKPDDPKLDPIDDLLRRPAPVSSEAVGGPLCGDPELLAAYSEQSLDAVARDEFQLHLAACTACREAVVQLLRLTPRGPVEPAAVVVHAPWWKWRGLLWGAPVLASMVLVGSIVMTRLQPGLPEIATPEVARPMVPRVVAPAPAAPATAPAAGPVVASNAPAEKQARADRDSSAQTFDRRKEPAASSSPVGSVFAPSPPSLPSDADMAKLKSQLPLKDEKKAEANGFLPRQDTKEMVVVESSSQVQQLQQHAVGGGGGGTGAGAAGANGVQNAANQSSPYANAYAQQQAPAPALAARAMAKVAPEKTITTCNIVKGMLFLVIGGGPPLDLKTPEEITTCKFSDALNGEIHGKSGRDYRTKDGGKTWLEVPKSEPPKD
jgi:hypothetical protein